MERSERRQQDGGRRRAGALPSRERDRGVSIQVSYVVTLGITSVLVVGLVATTGSFVDTQTERAAEHELAAIGNRIATQISQADQLAARGGNVSLTIRQPRRVAGNAYSVALAHGADCSAPLVGTDDCLVLTAQDPGVTVTVPVVNTTTVELTTVGPGTFRVSATPTAPAEAATGGDDAMTIGVGEDVTEGAGGETVAFTNKKPVAKFVFRPGAPTDESNIDFESRSTDVDGTITTYEWDLDGDGSVEQTGQSFTFSYAKPGRYNVTLTVTDDDGATSSKTKTIVVSGLIYQQDADVRDYDGNLVPAGLTFNVTNRHDHPVVVQEVYIDPRDQNIVKLKETAPGGTAGNSEVHLDADPGPQAFYEPGDPGRSIRINDDGVIVDIDQRGSGNDLLVSQDDSFQISLSEFRKDLGVGNPQQSMIGRVVTIGIRYKVDGEHFVSKFEVGTPGAPGNEAPKPSFNVTCNERECQFNASASSDPDGNIVAYNWRFGDGASGTGEVVNYTYPRNDTFTATLTVVDDSATSAATAKTVDVGGVGFDQDVNFQPAWAAVPVGYVKDSGDAYGSRSNGFTYGWVDSSGTPTDTKATRDRGEVADQKWDTLNFGLNFGGGRTWEIDVPDKRYRVYVAMGDPDFNDSRHDVNVEGTVFEDPDPRRDHRERYTATVPVTDGRLSISPAAGSDNAKLQFVEISSIDGRPFDVKGGQVVVEAEHFRTHRKGNNATGPGSSRNMTGNWWWRVEDPDASGGRGLTVTENTGDNAGDTRNGPRLDYDVDFDATGTYYVWVRMRCSSSSDDSVHVGLNGNPVTFGAGHGSGGGLSEGCSGASGWTWVHQYDDGGTTRGATIQVTSTGVHTLNVWAREDGTMIDKIVVTDDPTYNPSGEGPPESDRS